MFNRLNIELTSRCNKSCWMCGRRKLERECPDLCDWGDMDHNLLWKISRQVPAGTLVQLHNNGDPLLSPNLGYAFALFRHCIRCFNTNGKLLLEKADEIIGHMEVLTISVIENDPEGEEQYDIVKRFLEIKGERSPRIVYRLLGSVDNRERWESLPGLVAKRVLHSPDGSRDYQKVVTIPEVGICQDLLTGLAIDRYGNISMCVRFDISGSLRLGNVKEIGLDQAWNSPKRKAYIKAHVEGKRADLPGCGECHYYGIPRGE